MQEPSSKFGSVSKRSREYHLLTNPPGALFVERGSGWNVTQMST